MNYYKVLFLFLIIIVLTSCKDKEKVIDPSVLPDSVWKLDEYEGEISGKDYDMFDLEPDLGVCLRKDVYNYSAVNDYVVQRPCLEVVDSMKYELSHDNSQILYIYNDGRDTLINNIIELTAEDFVLEQKYNGNNYTFSFVPVDK